MKKNLVNAVRRNKLVKRGGILVIATALAAGSWYGVNQMTLQTNVPELTTSVDDFVFSVGDEDVPLASSKATTTTKTNTKTTKKTVKLKKASTKTYKVTKPSTKKNTTKTTKGKAQTVKVDTTTVTSVVEQYTKKSKNKVVTTKVTTTTKTTTTPLVTSTSKTANTATVKSVATSVTAAKSESTEEVKTLSVTDIASKADQSLLNAYTTLKFDVTVNSSASYSGYFDAKAQNITLKKNDDTIYHELGHFLAFIAGNADTKDAFVAIYKDEKGNFTGVNKAYATQNSSEYFAESYKDYVLNPSTLESERPQTYESIKSALDTITDSHIQRIQKVYGSVWKK